MTTTEIIALAVSIVSGLVGLTTLFTFIATRKQKQRDEGATLREKPAPNAK